MDRHGDNLRRLEAVAATQHHVFTREQAARERFTPTMQFARRRSGDWVVVLPGVYRFASSTPTFRMRCMAAVLWSAPDGMVSHVSGGALWELEGMHRPLDVDLLVPRHRRLDSDVVIVHRSGDLLPADRSMRFGIPVASPLRVVLDVAASVDGESLELTIEDGLRRRLFTVRQLEWRAGLRTGRGYPGSRVIADLIERHGSTVTDSGWELRIERCLVAAGLPLPMRQVPIDTSLGRLHVDLAYPGAPVIAFEYDSDRWHSGVARRHADMERRNALRAAGVVVVEVNAGVVARSALPDLVRDLMGDPSLRSSSSPRRS